MTNYEKLLNLAEKDPKLFKIAAESVLNIIDLTTNRESVSDVDVEAKFEHSRDLFIAEFLLDGELERKGKMADEIMNLIFKVAIHSLIG